MGRRDEYDDFDSVDPEAIPSALVIQKFVGGSASEVAQHVRDNPSLLVEIAAVMGLPVSMVRLQLERALEGEDRNFIKETVDKAGSALELAHELNSQRFESHTTKMRKALAISRLESCYTTLYSMGVQGNDWRAVKAAATVATDIARVDGTLKEQATIQSELDKAAATIREQRAKRLTHNPGEIIEGALVGEKEIEHGRVGGVQDLGGAFPVGHVEFD